MKYFLFFLCSFIKEDPEIIIELKKEVLSEPPFFLKDLAFCHGKDCENLENTRIPTRENWIQDYEIRRLFPQAHVRGAKAVRLPPLPVLEISLFEKALEKHLTTISHSHILWKIQRISGKPLKVHSLPEEIRPLPQELIPPLYKGPWNFSLEGIHFHEEASYQVELRAFSRRKKMKKNLKKGEFLKKEDWEEVWGPFLSKEESEITGGILRMQKMAGSYLERKDFLDPYSVLHGQPVKIFWRQGDLSVSCQGKSLENGRKGDKVRVEGLSKKILVGTVSSQGEVYL